METDIQNFYSGKSVFLTGSTGSLGKVLLEKILRVTSAKVYILVRQKDGQTVGQRLNNLLEEPIFGPLRQIKPNFTERIMLLEGDTSLTGLGLSKESYELLERTVNIVIHSAATLRFNEPLSKALKVNTRGTLELIELAKRMQDLKAFVHISTCYVNCLKNHFDEAPLNERDFPDPMRICRLLENLDDESCNKLEAHVRKKFPNTYVYTKSLAEIAINQNSLALPVCIFRPAIITPTIKEPLVGWAGNYAGPLFIVGSFAHGILRVFRINSNVEACFVPLDYCVSLTMALAWKVGESREKYTTPSKVYNLVTDSRNPVKYKDMINAIAMHGPKVPLSKMLWYPIFFHTNSKLTYEVLTFFLHTTPALILHLTTALTGDKTRWLRIYRRMRERNDELYYFIAKPWTFSMENTNAFWQSLSKNDQEMFPFEMSKINWSLYVENSLKGLRQYLVGENDSTIAEALDNLKRLKMKHRLLQIALIIVGFVICCEAFT